MADAVLVEIAKDVLATLNSAAVADTFSKRFKAERSYKDWDENLEDQDTLHVDVVPVGYDETELASRGSVRDLASVHIGVRQRFGSDAQDPATGRVELGEIDKLVNLLEQIARYFMDPENVRLPAAQQAAWSDTKILFPYVPKHIRENRQYTGVIRIRFEVDEDL